MIHETAAKEVHPGAAEFKPVRNLPGTSVIGWTFEIPKENSAVSIDYGWVTLDGEVSGDRLNRLDRAVRNLRAYRSVKNREKRKSKLGNVFGGLS